MRQRSPGDIFNFAYYAMIQDLSEAAKAGLLAQNELIRALACHIDV